MADALNICIANRRHMKMGAQTVVAELVGASSHTSQATALLFPIRRKEDDSRHHEMYSYLEKRLFSGP